jgi:hypothetical protein
LDSIKDVDNVVRPPTWPFERKDEPASGAPLLYVHLSLYTDATVIALGLPHVLADQMGVANIMRAWFGLAYENTTPPEMTGYNEDVFQTPTTKAYAEYPHQESYRKGKSKVRNGWEYIFVIMGFLPELIFNRTEREHMVFFPRPMLDGLKERYRKELTAQYGADPGLSTGDVVSAILTKVCSPSSPYCNARWLILNRSSREWPTKRIESSHSRNSSTVRSHSLLIPPYPTHP